GGHGFASGLGMGGVVTEGFGAVAGSSASAQLGEYARVHGMFRGREGMSASAQWEDRQERFFGSFCLLGGAVGAQVRGPVVPDRAHDRQAGVVLGGEGDPA